MIKKTKTQSKRPSFLKILLLILAATSFVKTPWALAQSEDSEFMEGMSNSNVEQRSRQQLGQQLSAEVLENLRDPFQIPEAPQREPAPQGSLRETAPHEAAPQETAPHEAAPLALELVGNELEQYSLGAFRLTGIITGPKKVKALITGPSGKSYFVSIGDQVGIRNGRVTSIQPDKILISVNIKTATGKNKKEVYEMSLNKKGGARKL